MQDKVGSQVPTTDQIEQLVADVEAIAERIAAFTVTLAADERASTVKMRTGGEPIVADIAKLASDHGITLPQITVDGMLADLTLSQRIRPLANAVEQLNQRLSDTVLEAQSECWWATTALYTSLLRVSSGDPVLAAALKPIVDFFALGRRKRATAGKPEK